MVAEATPSPVRERIFTPPLVVFLVLLAGLLVFAAIERFALPTVPESIRLLADGDLDGAERERVLRALVSRTADSPRPEEQWAGLFAAAALGERAAWNAAWQRLGAASTLTPPPEKARSDLHLGDPLLANLGAAIWAEAAADRDRARGLWQVVQAQVRLAPAPLAAELAAAALERLR